MGMVRNHSELGKKLLNTTEMQLLKYHEAGHKRLWFTLCLNQKQRWALERQCQREAMQQMIAEGHSFNDLIMAEVNYRLLEKYGLRYLDFVEAMK